MCVALVYYVIIAAIRDKLILSMLASMIVAASLSIFLGGSAVMEQQQFTIIFAASSLRLVSILGLVLFVVFFIRRSFENKDIEFLLSRPVSRVSIIFSYSAALSCLAAAVSATVIAVIFALSPLGVSTDILTWGISLLMEAVIMVNIALFFALFLTSAPSAVMVVFAFYVLCRMMGEILGIIDGFALEHGENIFVYVMEAISSVLPRLDLLSQSSWLIYGVDTDFSLLVSLSHGVVFTLLVLCAACLDFLRKEY